MQRLRYRGAVYQVVADGSSVGRERYTVPKNDGVTDRLHQLMEIKDELEDLKEFAQKVSDAGDKDTASQIGHISKMIAQRQSRDRIGQLLLDIPQQYRRWIPAYIFSKYTK